MSPSIFLFIFWVSTASISEVMGLNILTAENALFGNQTQYLNNSDFYLVMQPDCNMVLYQGPDLANSDQVWHTDITVSGGTDCKLVMQTDGNLVIYNVTCEGQSCAFWSTATNDPYSNNKNVYMILRDDGTLEAFAFNNGAPLPLWNLTTTGLIFPAVGVTINGVNSTTGGKPSFDVNIPSTLPTLNIYPPVLRPNIHWPYMPVGYYMDQGSSLENYPWRLTLNDNCTLQSNNTLNDTLVWEISPSNVLKSNGPCQLALEQYGNLQLRTNNSNGLVLWESNTAGDPSVIWILYLDSRTGNVLVTDIANPTNNIWTYPSSISTPNRHPIALFVGLIGGGLFISIISTLLIYRFACTNCISKAEKELHKRLKQKGGKLQALRFAQLKVATNNFEKKIGEGGFGEVFYGRLVGGQEVAIKTLSTTSHQTKEEFFNEIELFSLVNHKSLVSLVGYCIAQNQQILVYEYMIGGDLQKRLQGKSARKEPLSWKQRTNIILQIAEGLEYLHTKCHPAIIHRDVKSSNILLTESLDAKVADFGISKLRAIEQNNATHITTMVKGTPGYLDPEYHQTGMLTEKSDVYAFGIVLMEILTAQNQLGIGARVSEAWRSNQLGGLVDPNMKGDFENQEFSNLVQLSLWCVRRRGSDRPSMDQVLQTLREFGLVQVGSQPYEAKGVDHEEHNVSILRALEADDFMESEFSPEDAMISPLILSMINSSSSSSSNSSFMKNHHSFDIHTLS